MLAPAGNNKNLEIYPAQKESLTKNIKKCRDLCAEKVTRRVTEVMNGNR